MGSTKIGGGYCGLRPIAHYDNAGMVGGVPKSDLQSKGYVFRGVFRRSRGGGRHVTITFVIQHWVFIIRNSLGLISVDLSEVNVEHPISNFECKSGGR